MENEIKYGEHKVTRWVVAFIGEKPVGEYDNMAEAKKDCGGFPGIKLRYAAAEQINDDGDVNPACYGDTLKEAMDKLKSVLKTDGCAVKRVGNTIREYKKLK